VVFLLSPWWPSELPSAEKATRLQMQIPRPRRTCPVHRIIPLPALSWALAPRPKRKPGGLSTRHKEIGERPSFLHPQGSHEEPKTAAGRRRVPLFDDVAAFFEARRFAATYQAENDPVFAHVTGETLQHRGVQRGFDNARDKARERLHGGFSHDDGRPVTFHDLRHAFASRCASRGVPVETLSAVMGHTNVGITQSIYLHLYGREEAEARFREAMNGKSLASTDPEHPELTGESPEANSGFGD
jgi:hypothetical protein